MGLQAVAQSLVNMLAPERQQGHWGRGHRGWRGHRGCREFTDKAMSDGVWAACAAGKVGLGLSGFPKSPQSGLGCQPAA